MKTYQTDHVKNIVLLGNSGSGKTTLAEAMMFEGGIIARKGDVDQKNTVSDFREIEQENERSIYSTVCYTEYADQKVARDGLAKQRPRRRDLTGPRPPQLHVMREGTPAETLRGHEGECEDRAHADELGECDRNLLQREGGGRDRMS